MWLPLPKSNFNPPFRSIYIAKSLSGSKQEVRRMGKMESEGDTISKTAGDSREAMTKCKG